MKKILIIVAMVVMLASCADKSSVNILISNTNPTDTVDAVVRVPIEKIIQHLEVQNVDSLILLNEKNQRVDFNVAHGNQDIEFVVPVVKAHSQKNYSLNVHDDEEDLKENIFSFRSTSITVKL